MRARARTVARALLAVVVACAVAAGCSSSTSPRHLTLSGGAAVPLRSGDVLQYAAGRQLTLTVPRSRPPAARAPWVLVVHGGGWVHGAPSDMQSSADLLAAHGYLALNVGYRLVGPGVTFADQFSDVVAAWSWIRAHAAALAIDPDRGAVWGTSAGGHLAALLGNRVPGVRAVVSLAGVLVPSVLPRLGARATSTERELTRVMETTVVGSMWSPTNPVWRAFDPGTYLTASSPPTLIVQGTADVIVPPSTAVLYADELTAHGVAHQVVSLPGVGHDGAALARGAAKPGVAFLGRWTA